MKSILRVTVSSLAALCALAVLSEAPAAESKPPVRINGAAAASDQVQNWAHTFASSHPDVSVVVVGSSAGKGLQSLITGNSDLGLATRPITTSEEEKASAKGLKLESRLIGYAGLAIVTTKRNPVNELSLGQIEKIFTGEYTRWSQVGGPDEAIRCLSRRVPESGVAVFFMENALHNQPFGKTTQFTETWGSIMKVCTAGKDLPIAIAPTVLARKAGVKVIRVKRDDQSPGVLPTEETLRNKTYPIIVPIRLYWNTQTQDERIAKFVEFCEKEGLAGGH